MSLQHPKKTFARRRKFDLRQLSDQVKILTDLVDQEDPTVNMLREQLKEKDREIDELRKKLSENQESIEIFIKENNYRKREMPKITDKIQMAETGWQDRKTAYFDIIELIKYYPYFMEESI